MGKKKVDCIKYIADKNQRNVTYSKRKRGLLKKSIEISRMCGKTVFLVVYDSAKHKMVEFRSTKQFDVDFVKKLIDQKEDDHMKHELVTNLDYARYDNDKEEKDLDQLKINHNLPRFDGEESYDGSTVSEAMEYCDRYRQFDFGGPKFHKIF